MDNVGKKKGWSESLFITKSGPRDWRNALIFFFTAWILLFTVH